MLLKRNNEKETIAEETTEQEPGSAKDFFTALKEIDKKVDYVHWEVKRATGLLIFMMSLLVMAGALAFYFRNWLF